MYSWTDEIYSTKYLGRSHNARRYMFRYSLHNFMGMCLHTPLLTCFVGVQYILTHKITHRFSFGSFLMKKLYQFTAFNHVMFAFLWTLRLSTIYGGYLLMLTFWDNKRKFSENWLQILKIVRSCKLRPETRFFFFFLWLLRLKACARKKTVIKLKNKVREHFLNFCCVVVEFMQ